MIMNYLQQYPKRNRRNNQLKLEHGTCNFRTTESKRDKALKPRINDQTKHRTGSGHYQVVWYRQSSLVSTGIHCQCQSVSVRQFSLTILPYWATL